jgi:hypothetical protein
MEIDWNAVSEAEEECGGVFAIDPETLALREKILRGEAQLENRPRNFRIKPEDVEILDI